MSNYNSTLQSNNIDLQAILDTINELPEAGTGEQAAPVISVNSNGLITATAGTKSSTHQLAFQAAKTITPSTASQIAVSSGYYTGGNITVAAVPTQTKSVTPKSTSQDITPDSGKFLSKVTVTGDSNLVAGNIKSGVSIFGVSGTLEGDSSGETVVDDVSKAIISGTITEISDDNVETIGKYVFYRCDNLTSVNFPACTTISNNAFDCCFSLTTVSFPVCTSIGNFAFYNCSSLTTVSFPVCTSIGNGAFTRCHDLKSLYLTGSSLCTLSNSNAFSSTPIGGYSASAGAYGSIYVPASLLTSYQTATNWTYFSSRFAAFEDGDVGGDTGGDTVSTITFDIDGTIQQAEEGMTWADWCESSYNTDGYVTGMFSKVYNNTGHLVCHKAGLGIGDEVSADEAIMADCSYTLD